MSYPPSKDPYPVQPPTAPGYPVLETQTAGYPAQPNMSSNAVPTSYPPPQSTPSSYPPHPPTGQTQTVVITPTGNCPSCHQGNLVEGFSLCGIIWAICCFPIGLICCLTMKEKKCGVCGYHN